MKSMASLASYCCKRAGWRLRAYRAVAMSEREKSSIVSSNHASERCGCLKLGEPVSLDFMPFIEGTYIPS